MLLLSWVFLILLLSAMESPFAAASGASEVCTTNCPLGSIFSYLLKVMANDAIMPPQTNLKCSKNSTRTLLAAEEEVQINSPNFPSLYPAKTECGWKFKRSDPATRLTLSCPAFYLKKAKNENCTDYLQVNDIKYCGSKAPVFNATEDLALTFKSEDGLMPGFNCTIAANLLKDKLQPIVKDSNNAPETVESGDTQTTNSTEKQTRCGEKYDVFGITRIVGGEQTTPYEYPWQVGLVQTSSRNVFCGGSIITKNWILTAAHCAASMVDKESRFKVLVGAYILSSPTIIQRSLSIRRIILHENYNPHELDNDIAFLEVDPIEFSPRVGPVCLPDPQGYYENVTGTVTGWGTLKADGEPSNVLMEVRVPTMTNAKCRQAYGDYLTQNMLCAGYARGGKDSCQGDSGGPLVYQSSKHGRWEQIGIVSWGSGCAGVGTPGVYTRLTSYIDWINNIIQGSN
ncbi:clotting factor G beta subunit-like [Penaeus japonicus]|uniref:clotting factor G beta subunit-like n=1 Tax=Penaeus japonicus TaxID=27405 RepID=UPI001C70E76B|nr:clotting factor G beta subunit-like [Penaeus japonicus]